MELTSFSIELNNVIPVTIDRSVLFAELQQIEARAAQIKELLEAA